MSLLKSPWGEYQRKNPAVAATLVSAFVHCVCVVVVVGCLFYALKYKPFQSMPSISMAPAHPISRHNSADEHLLRRVGKVAPVASMPTQATIVGTIKRKIASIRKSTGT